MAGTQGASFTETGLTFNGSRVLEAKDKTTIDALVAFELHGAV